MIGTSFWRINRAAFQNFFRNIWLSIATMVIMTITLLIVMFLYFANVFGLEVLQNVEQKVDLSVVFKDEASAEKISNVARTIEARQDVVSVRVITSDDALEIFRQRNVDKPFIAESLKELEDNPLPASMFIVATEPQFYETISGHLSSERYEEVVDEVNFDSSRDVINKLIGIIETVKKVGLVVTTIFSILVVLIMFNTVRLAIYSFREEIDIMTLVGASRSFIRGPFVIEAVLVALLSVGIATAIIYPALKAVSPELQQFFFAGYTQTEPFDLYAYAIANWTAVVGTELAVAVGLAVFSSLIAVQRYLRA